MNDYSFEDLYIGLKESFTVTVTEEMLEGFLKLTGDINPLHTDGEFARARGYEDRVAYGMLTSSFLSTLAGVYLPGKRSLIREVNVLFKKPVYVGNTLTVSGEVTSLDADFNIFEMKVTICNEEGVKVLRGKMQMGVLG